MKLLIAGSRGIIDQRGLDSCMAEVIEDRTSGGKIDLVITGGALGVDTLGERWADKRSIPTKIVKPDWEKYGTRAGLARNGKMVNMLSKGDMVVIMWDGRSRGTKSTIDLAEKAGIETFVFEQRWVLSER